MKREICGRGSIVPFLVVAALALGTGPWVGRASAQYRRDYGGGGAGNQSATASAGRQVHDAQAALNAVQTQITHLRASVRAQLETRPQWASVVAQQKRAQAEFDAAQRAALARLQRDPAYAKMVDERSKARQTLAAADDPSSSISDDEIKKATALLFSDGLKMEKMKNDLLANDPKYLQAKAALDAARVKLDQLDEEVTNTIQGQSDYQQLAQQLDQAKQQLETARQQLASAAQADRQAREQEEKSREQQQNYGGGGAR